MKYGIILGCIVTALSYAQVRTNAVHTEGKLSQSTVAIFKILGFAVATLQEANTVAQQYFLRHGERWEAQQETAVRTRMKSHSVDLVAHLKALGMVDGIEPRYKQYKYAMVLGSLVKSVKTYITLLERLQQQCCTFKYIVILGSVGSLQNV